MLTQNTFSFLHRQMKPRLFIFSGLPGAGKSSLAKLLAATHDAAWLRVDTIEQALRDLCDFEPQGEGYRLAYRIAADNLQTGISVVADSCNPWESTRREWEEVAVENGAVAVNIEVICSNRGEHRRRIETRTSEVRGLQLPTWKEVEARDYHPWTSPRIIIDTAGKTVEQSFEELNRKIT
jgi:predicted kinase